MKLHIIKDNHDSLMRVFCGHKGEELPDIYIDEELSYKPAEPGKKPKIVFRSLTDESIVDTSELCVYCLHHALQEWETTYKERELVREATCAYCGMVLLRKLKYHSRTSQRVEVLIPEDKRHFCDTHCRKAYFVERRLARSQRLDY